MATNVGSEATSDASFAANLLTKASGIASSSFGETNCCVWRLRKRVWGEISSYREVEHGIW